MFESDLEETSRIFIEGLGQCHQLDDVDAPLPRFDIGHGGLKASQAARQVALRQTARLARRLDRVDESAETAGPDRVRHCLALDR